MDKKTTSPLNPVLAGLDPLLPDLAKSYTNNGRGIAANPSAPAGIHHLR